MSFLFANIFVLFSLKVLQIQLIKRVYQDFIVDLPSQRSIQSCPSNPIHLYIAPWQIHPYHEGSINTEAQLLGTALNQRMLLYACRIIPVTIVILYTVSFIGNIFLLHTMHNFTQVCSFWHKISRHKTMTHYFRYADVRFGISYALSHLNFEFSKNTTTMVPFSPEEEGIMEVAGLKVSEWIPIELSRQILVATT